MDVADLRLRASAIELHRVHYGSELRPEEAGSTITPELNERETHAILALAWDGRFCGMHFLLLTPAYLVCATCHLPWSVKCGGSVGQVK